MASGSNNALAGQSPARSIAQAALTKLCNEAEFLQRMCDGQASNIRQMSEELESLRRMNDRQADTIARLQDEIGAIEPFRKMKLATYGQLLRDAEFGRKMAAVAGVNIV